MNILKKLASQTAIYGFSSVIGRLLNYLLVPLYTRFFIPSDYGIVTEVYAYVAFLVVLLTYGFETAFFRFSKKEKDSRTVYSTALLSVIISSGFFILIMFLASSSIANFLGYGIEGRFVKWFGIIVGVDAISSISFAKLRKEQRAFRFAIIRILGILLNILLNLYFIVYNQLGIEYIFISNLISSGFTLFLLMPEMISSTFVFDSNLWKKMMIYALPLLVAGMAGITNETIDRILLKKLLLNTQTASFELGLYGAFYKLSIIMLLFVQTFRFAAEPFFFSQHKNKDHKKIYADVMKYFTIIMIVIFLAVIIFYDFVICFLGAGYHDSRGFLVVSLLLLANLFLGMFFNLSIWYKLTDKTVFGAYLSLMGAVITLTLNFILIPKFSFIGCAIATLVCYLSMTVVSFFWSKKHFPIPYQVTRISVYLALMVVIYFVVYFIDLNISINSLFLLGFIIFAYILETSKTYRT